MIPATVVEVDALWQTVVAALVAGLGTTLAFSLAILGAVRFADERREGRNVQAAIAGALAVVALLATASAIVAAVIVMTSK